VKIESRKKKEGEKGTCFVGQRQVGGGTGRPVLVRKNIKKKPRESPGMEEAEQGTKEACGLKRAPRRANFSGGRLFKRREEKSANGTTRPTPSRGQQEYRELEGEKKVGNDQREKKKKPTPRAESEKEWVE